jgi:hypothetical protein
MRARQASWFALLAASLVAGCGSSGPSTASNGGAAGYSAGGSSGTSGYDGGWDTGTGASGGTASLDGGAGASNGGASTGGSGASGGNGGTAGGSGGSSGGGTSGSGGAAPAGCPCYSGDGLYCETSAAAYAASNHCSVGSSNSNDLLSCSGGNWSVNKTCSNGCTPEQSGTPDQCAGACSGTNLSGFVSNFTGQCTGYPGWSPSNQCTDLALQWVSNLCLPVQFSGNAINWASESVPGFTWVGNASGKVPSPGDIVVFGADSCDLVSGVGHVDIAVSASASSCSWQTFDQNWQTNWNGTCYPPQLVNRNWCNNCDNVLGWQHLTAPIP